MSAYRTGAWLATQGHQFAVVAGHWLLSELPPQVFTANVLSTLPLGPFDRATRAVAAQGADRAVHKALLSAFGEDYRDFGRHPHQAPDHALRAGPVRVVKLRNQYTATTRDIPYGDGGVANNLDIWRRQDLPDAGRAPVLLHIPGGAWTVNDKNGQGYSVLNALVRHGWIGVSINYRRSPRHAWPAHIVDVKQAIAWVRQNIAEYGGDPAFIAVTGGSAGGHLSALAALTPNVTTLQPGFESADTSVQAAVPLYGVFDVTRPELMHPRMLPHLEKSVIKARFDERPELFRAASPVRHVGQHAPPFFLIHGLSDSVVPVTQSRAFHSALLASGAPTVAYAELPNTHHLFDYLATIRTQVVTEAIATFLAIAYDRRSSDLTRSAS